MAAQSIAVTGASGNVGGAVVNGLLDAGHTNAIALARNPARLDALSPAVAARRADYGDRAELASALAGVETLVFVSSDGEAAPMLVHHMNVLDAAADVGFIVYLSIVDVAPDSPFCFAPVHRETERMLERTGIPHTTVRASMYGEFFARWITKAVASGRLELPMGTGRLSLVSRDDVARCLVACAIERGSGLREVTGDRTYGLADLAALAEQFTQVPVEAEDVDLQEFCGRLLHEGVSPWWAYAFTSMFEAVSRHHFETVTDHVLKLTGRQATPFDAIAQQALHT